MNLPPYPPRAVPLYRVRPVLPSSCLAVLFSRQEFGLVDVGRSRQEGNVAVGRERGELLAMVYSTCHGASFRGCSKGGDSLSSISSGSVWVCFYFQTSAVNLFFVYEDSQLHAVQVSV